MASIDLGRKYDQATPCCAPSPEKTQQVHYPSLYIDGGKELRDLPREGVLKLRYRTARRSEVEREGDKRTELELEALEILSATAAEEQPKSRESELDALRKETDED